MQAGGEAPSARRALTAVNAVLAMLSLSRMACMKIAWLRSHARSAAAAAAAASPLCASCTDKQGYDCQAVQVGQQTCIHSKALASAELTQTRWLPKNQRHEERETWRSFDRQKAWVQPGDISIGWSSSRAGGRTSSCMSSSAAYCRIGRMPCAAR